MRSMTKRFMLSTAAAALIASPAIAADMSGSDSGAKAETQMQGQSQGQQMQGQASANFSDDKLKSFAEAVTGIQQVARDYAPRLRDAENPQQVAELEQEAQDAMMQTVKDEGLSVEEYNQIAVAAQTDPQLAQEIQGYMGGGEGNQTGGTTD